MTHRPGPAILILAAALSAVFWLAGGQARGQSTATGTGTPTTGTPVVLPTVTSTPTIPGAQDLLTRTGAAVTAKNTFHETSRVTVEVPSIARQVQSLQADISGKPLLEHAVETIRMTQLNTQPAKTTTQHDEIVVVKKKLAVKVGKKAWSCTSVPSAAQTAQALGQVIGTPTLKSVETLGAETINSIPVWHVRAIATLSVSGSSAPLTADYFISQADLTMVRVTVSGSVTVSGVTASVTSVQDYTKYGEKVKVTLPAACKGKSLAANSLLHSADPRTAPQLAAVDRLLPQLLQMVRPIPLQIQ